MSKSALFLLKLCFFLGMGCFFILFFFFWLKPAGRTDLGFYMESQLKSQTHIAKVCGTAYYTFKNVARIRNLVTPEVARIIQGLSHQLTGLLQWALVWSIKSSAE